MTKASCLMQFKLLGEYEVLVFWLTWTFLIKKEEISGSNFFSALIFLKNRIEVSGLTSCTHDDSILFLMGFVQAKSPGVGYLESKMKAPSTKNQSCLQVSLLQICGIDQNVALHASLTASNSLHFHLFNSFIFCPVLFKHTRDMCHTR